MARPVVIKIGNLERYFAINKYGYKNGYFTFPAFSQETAFVFDKDDPDDHDVIIHILIYLEEKFYNGKPRYRLEKYDKNAPYKGGNVVPFYLTPKNFPIVIVPVDLPITEADRKIVIKAIANEKKALVAREK